jgi:hypothetical protein
MILVPMVVLTLTAAPSPASPLWMDVTPKRPDCSTAPTKIGSGGAVSFQRLADLPDAHAEIAVNRFVGGCPAPVIVRYNVNR